MILLQFPGKTDRGIVEFTQKYDTKSTSWKVKYRHHKHGLIEDIPYRGRVEINTSRIGKVVVSIINLSQGPNHRVPIAYYLRSSLKRQYYSTILDAAYYYRERLNEQSI